MPEASKRLRKSTKMQSYITSLTIHVKIRNRVNFQWRFLCYILKLIERFLSVKFIKFHVRTSYFHLIKILILVSIINSPKHVKLHQKDLKFSKGHYLLILLVWERHCSLVNWNYPNISLLLTKYATSFFTNAEGNTLKLDKVHSLLYFVCYRWPIYLVSFRAKLSL